MRLGAVELGRRETESQLCHFFTHLTLGKCLPFPEFLFPHLYSGILTELTSEAICEDHMDWTSLLFVFHLYCGKGGAWKQSMASWVENYVRPILADAPDFHRVT